MIKQKWNIKKTHITHPKQNEIIGGIRALCGKRVPQSESELMVRREPTCKACAVIVGRLQ